jgi:hypothetical protein
LNSKTVILYERKSKIIYVKKNKSQFIIAFNPNTANFVIILRIRCLYMLYHFSLTLKIKKLILNHGGRETKESDLLCPWSKVFKSVKQNIIYDAALSLKCIYWRIKCLYIFFCNSTKLMLMFYTTSLMLHFLYRYYRPIKKDVAITLLYHPNTEFQDHNIKMVILLFKCFFYDHDTF